MLLCGAYEPALSSTSSIALYVRIYTYFSHYTLCLIPQSMYICICLCICICICICICVYVYMYICIYVYMYICMYIYIYVYIYIYMYMYICIYVYMYICIYVYVYVYVSAEPCWGGASEIPKGCLFVCLRHCSCPFPVKTN